MEVVLWLLTVCMIIYFTERSLLSQQCNYAHNYTLTAHSKPTNDQCPRIICGSIHLHIHCIFVALHVVLKVSTSEYIYWCLFSDVLCSLYVL